MSSKHALITAAQVRAARALLNWSQEDLASASNLSVTTIRNIEAGNISPRDSTMGAIVSALEDSKIEFYQSAGVRIKENIVSILEGESCYLHLLDDIFYTLKHKPSELLIWNADNSVSSDLVIQSELRLRKAGVKFRFLVKEEDTYLHFPLEEYRWIPKSYFRNSVQEIYENKVALMLYPDLRSQQVQRIIIIENPALAESNRNAFNFMWNNCRTPTHSTAREIFR